MWKREVKDDYLDNLGKCFTCLNFLWKSDNAPIYIMDNHLAAAWCWMQECNTEEKYNFMHIDQHDDLGACGFTKDIESLRTTPHISINEYDKITYTTLGGSSSSLNVTIILELVIFSFLNGLILTYSTMPNRLACVL